MAKGPEILDPVHKGGLLTRVTALVRLGRGVTGNTTFGLWAIALVAMVLGTAFITTGHPEHAITLLYICVGWYSIYQIISWVGAICSPDIGVTGDDDYANIVATRHIGAQNRNLISDELPVVGASARAASEAKPTP
jgi:hypothetical protein